MLSNRLKLRANLSAVSSGLYWSSACLSFIV
jgi:hypothetical protein